MSSLKDSTAAADAEMDDDTHPADGEQAVEASAVEDNTEAVDAQNGDPTSETTAVTENTGE